MGIFKGYSRSLDSGSSGGFQRLGVPFWGIPMIRTLVFWSLNWGFLETTISVVMCYVKTSVNIPDMLSTKCLLLCRVKIKLNILSLSGFKGPLRGLGELHTARLTAAKVAYTKLGVPIRRIIV